MRADRLLALLMLLQARGRMTARELARDLEVSERTIYRDIDALSMAGVPVYGVPGPDGGFALVDRYRTSLTGLTDGEIRALFMLSIPAPLVDLGIGEELRSALRKLSAALPDGRGGDRAWARQRLHLDAAWWRQGQESVPHLQTSYQAVWQDRKLHVVYRPTVAVEMERLVAPYGLVAKAGGWYLVWARTDVWAPCVCPGSGARHPTVLLVGRARDQADNGLSRGEQAISGRKAQPAFRALVPGTSASAQAVLGNDEQQVRGAETTRRRSGRRGTSTRSGRTSCRRVCPVRGRCRSAYAATGCGSTSSRPSPTPSRV